MAIIADLKRAETKAKEDTTIYVQTPGLWLPEKGVIFEQVEGEQFLLNNGQTAKIIPKGTNTAYTPISQDEINWNLCTPTQIQPVNKKKLWRFIKRFIWRSVELPDERLYEVLTAWVFATWISEKWGTAPYVFFVGVKNSGKTRGLETLQVLTCRGKISVSATAPALFRSIEKFNCVPFLDEAEVYNQDEKVDVIACLNAGYKRRSAIIERCQGDNQEIKSFHVFGFKGIAGTEALKATLESRSIIITMAKNTRQLDIVLNDKAAQTIRNRLLQWRFETLLGNTIQNQQTVNATFDDEYDEFDDYDEYDAKTKATLDIPEELRAIKNARVVEIFMPLCAVADEAEKKIIVDYAKAVSSQQKTEENTSIESEILLAIITASDHVENGAVANEYIENAFNFERTQKEQLFGKTLTSKIAALGFERCRVGKKRGFTWDTKKLRLLCERFGFDPENYQLKPKATSLLQSSDSSETSQSSESYKQNNRLQIPKLLSLDQVVVCHVLDLDQRAVDQLCPMCNQQPLDILYNVEFYDHSTAKICFNCGSRVLEHLQSQEMEAS